MNIFYYLKIGIALFLILSAPLIKISDSNIKIEVELTNLLTDEMQQLVNEGVELEFELYSSIITFDNKNNKQFLKQKVRRKVYFDFMENKFILVENNQKESFNTIDNLIEKSKRFNLEFSINTNEYKNYDFYCEVTLIENPIIKENLKMDTASLWNYYKPNMRFIFNNKGKVTK